VDHPVRQKAPLFKRYWQVADHRSGSDAENLGAPDVIEPSPQASARIQPVARGRSRTQGITLFHNRK
jgi:hypothetical protein